MNSSTEIDSMNQLEKDYFAVVTNIAKAGHLRHCAQAVIPVGTELSLSAL